MCENGFKMLFYVYIFMEIVICDILVFKIVIHCKNGILFKKKSAINYEKIKCVLLFC